MCRKAIFVVILAVIFACVRQEGDKKPEKKDYKKEKIFSFGQISDIHYSKDYDTSYLRDAIKFLNKQTLDFVLITGDLILCDAGDRDKNLKSIKKYLDSKLNAKYFAVKGNHEETNYEKIFGSANYSFDYGGVRFIVMGMDYDWKEFGLGWYKNVRWIENKITCSPDMPVIIVSHVPPAIPCSFGSAQLLKLLGRCKNIVMCISGHLHHEVEHDYLGIRHVVLPDLKWDSRHMIKIYDVYHDKIEIKTFIKIKGKYILEKQSYVYLKNLQISACVKQRAKNFDSLPATPTKFLPGSRILWLFYLAIFRGDKKALKTLKFLHAIYKSTRKQSKDR
jgi:Icc-related predicted phosphoesterase